MIYLNHDFYSNFSGGIKSGDTDMVANMFVNEMSDLVVYHHKKVINLLRKVQVKVKDSASDEEIVDSVLKTLPTNSKFNKGVAFLIAENNDLISEKGKDWTKKVDRISFGVQNISKRLQEKANYDSLIKEDLINAIKIKSEKVGDRGRKLLKGNGNKVYIFIGIGVLVLAGYYIWKNREYLAAPPEIPTVDA
jgi:hypothetical protein